MKILFHIILCLLFFPLPILGDDIIKIDADFKRDSKIIKEPIWDKYSQNDDQYWVCDAFFGTSLEGANACPSVVLPKERSSGSTFEENDLTSMEEAYKGWLPPEDYYVFESDSLLKLVKDANIDGIYLYEHYTGRIHRFESNKIYVFPNGIAETYDIVEVMNEAFKGYIEFIIVDAPVDVGVTFHRYDSRCGSAYVNYDGDLIVKADVYLGTGCGRWNNNINNGIHELVHALGFFTHSTIQDTTMTLGGRWNDFIADPEGEIDPVTVAVIKQIYLLEPGSKIIKGLSITPAINLLLND